MTELRINLTIAALTLAVVGSIGMLAEGLSRYLDRPGNAPLTAEHPLTRTLAAAPIDGSAADRPGTAVPAKVAMQ